MTTQNTFTYAQFRKEARGALAGKWTPTVLTTIIYTFLMAMVTTANHIIPLLGLVVGPAILYGYSVYILKVSRGHEGEMEDLFSGFSDRFVTIAITFIVVIVKIFLWSLLLIIPGLVAAFRYSQVFFILVDRKDLDAMEVIEESKKMMDGKKWDLFMLSLTFLGWAIFSLFTAGIGTLWLMPYMKVTFAKFYDSIKHHYAVIHNA